MEQDWQEAGTYEGWQLKVRPIRHVVFRYEAMATKEGKEPCKGQGTTEDGAIVHAKICVNREITKLGS